MQNTEIKKTHWTSKYIVPLDACNSAIRTARKYATPQEAWEAWCQGNEMLWILLRTETDQAKSLQCLCEIVEQVLPRFTKLFPHDERPRQAIEAAMRCADDPSRANRAAAYAAAEAAECASGVYPGVGDDGYAGDDWYGGDDWYDEDGGYIEDDEYIEWGEYAEYAAADAALAASNVAYAAAVATDPAATDPIVAAANAAASAAYTAARATASSPFGDIDDGYAYELEVQAEIVRKYFPTAPVPKSYKRRHETGGRRADEISD